MTDRPRGTQGMKAAWKALIRDRAVQGVLAVLLGWAIFWRVADGYGPSHAMIASVCSAWGYIILSSYVTHVLNARAANSDRGHDPRPPGGRWPGARP
jgi:hypothetical protein